MTEFSENLSKEVKKELLAFSEKTATEAVNSVFKIAELVVKDTENKFDDMLLPALPMLKEQVMKYVEKIKVD